MSKSDTYYENQRIRRKMFGLDLISKRDWQEKKQNRNKLNEELDN